jgi:hypothetical protein
MNSRLQSSKLAELHGKTDRQLIALIGNMLDRGIEFARQASEEKSRNVGASAGEFHDKAKKLHEEVALLLPVVRGLTNAEQRRLDSRLARLEALLDATEPESRVRSATAFAGNELF